LNIFGIFFEIYVINILQFMKTFLLLILTMFTCGFVQAQKSNLIFFAENGERFTIVMNGLRYNETPQTNVKLTDLQPAVYKVKAIFEDPALGVVTKTIPMEFNMEYTFNIRLKKKTEVGQAIKRAGRQVQRDAGVIDSSEVDAEQPETYVMRFVSEVPLVNAFPPAPVYQQAPPPAPAAVVYNTAPPAGTVTQTTTVRTQGTPTSTVVTPGAGVNMSVNDPELGVNFNMNVGVPIGGTVVTSGGTVQQTTTTTTYGNAVPVQQNVYVMPGYNGPVGCPWPMDQATFSNAQQTINNQTFEANKLQVAQQVIGSNCVTSAQVAQIMQTFDFEDSRLKFAKFAYGRTFDIGNYFVVNNAFDFSSSVDELNAHIASQPRR
jgi:hypothetical protein